MIKKYIFKLINGEIILGEVSVVDTDLGQHIVVKTPFTVRSANIHPYMADVLGSSPGAIQIHPMNILWQMPLDEFKHLDTQFVETTTGLITNQPKSHNQSKIIL